jgi:dienelactone hydrolase
LSRRPDTLVERWARLAPHVRVFGPRDGERRPAVLIFHGCGGVRPHLMRYAQAAADAGWRAFVVDSYAARGWPRLYGLAFVCSGATFRGHERAGDVAAAVYGISQRADVDPARLAVAGWSHGGWGIMELMAAALEHPGEIGLSDAHAADLSGVKAAVLVYPYIGAFAPARMQPWRRTPKTLAVIAAQDHLTTVRNAERVYDSVRGCGVDVECWTVDGTHAFDEDAGMPPMRHHPELTVEAIGRFRRFLQATLGPEPAGEPRRRARKA